MSTLNDAEIQSEAFEIADAIENALAGRSTIAGHVALGMILGALASAGKTHDLPGLMYLIEIVARRTLSARTGAGAPKGLPGTTAILQELARGLDLRLKPNGFVLLSFTPDGPAGTQTHYVSNCCREHMLVALKEVLARFEGRTHQCGRA